MPALVPSIAMNLLRLFHGPCTQVGSLCPSDVPNVSTVCSSEFWSFCAITEEGLNPKLTRNFSPSNVRVLLARVQACHRLTDLGTSPLDAFYDYGDSC